MRLDEHGPWISDIQRSFNAALKEMPALNLFMVEISILISQATTAIDLLQGIAQYLPESDTAKAPFSKRWCSAEVSPRPDPMVIEWALLVERHLTMCAAFAAAFDLDQSAVLSGALLLLGSTWDQPNPMNDCESVLQNQRKKLLDTRSNYAASFSERVAKAARSPIDQT